VAYVEVARAESERGEIVLRRRIEERAADALELRVNGVFVMDTRETTSETAMAAAALELVENPRRVVVGGLGLGFTAQRVLADHRVELVKVVEIEQSLIDWMRSGTIPHGPALLADRRLHVVDADIVVAVAEALSTYDLVLATNERVYQRDFLTATRRIIDPGGALVVWSANPAPELAETMEQVFGNCTEHPYDVLLQERPEQYLLYVSTVS
jgi:spermidine synthase